MTSHARLYGAAEVCLCVATHYAVDAQPAPRNVSLDARYYSLCVSAAQNRVSLKSALLYSEGLGNFVPNGSGR